MVEAARKALEWRREGRRVALAVVVDTWGSAPRGAGSLMAVCEDGRLAGSVSGGCVEAAILSDALDVIERRQPVLARFGTKDDKSWEVGSPCGGDVEVLVLPYDDELHGAWMDALAAGDEAMLVACLDGIPSPDAFENGNVSRETSPADTLPFAGAQAVITPHDQACHWMEPFFLAEALEQFDAACNAARAGETPATMRAATVFPCGARVFCCRYGTRPRIVCVGAVHIAAALVPIAKAVGYSVTVVDPRGAFLHEERFPQADRLVHGWPQEVVPALHLDASSALCALTHDPKIDVPTLAEGLKTPASYLGCLGHAETLLERAGALREAGFTEGDLARIRGPIGLWIGGRAPGDVALSIVAQIQAARFGRIDKGADMPGHTLDFFTEESVARIAAGRETRRHGEGR